MRLERRSSPPCPGADGQEVGSPLRVVLSCGVALDGEVIGTIPEATTLTQCADFCGTFHPRCEGINFSDADGCQLFGVPSGGGEIPTKPSRFVDSGRGQYPTLAQSSCRSGRQLAQGSSGTFEAMCGQVINGADIVQRHHTTFEGCATDCATTNGCRAFSFEASLDRGFNNCYLKSDAANGSLSFVEGIDTGVFSAANAGQQASAGTPNGFLTIVPANNAVATPSLDPGMVNPTPVSDSVPNGAPVNETPVVSVTQVVTAPSGTSPESQQGATSNGASLSWVAAPVVGGVAAILVVVVLIIMFRKRKNNSARSSSSGGSSWAPFGKSNKRAPPMEGEKGILGSNRSSAMQRLGSSDGKSVPVYEVKGGKVALRETTTEVQRPMTGLFRSND